MVMEQVSRLAPAERRLHDAILRAFPRFGGPPPRVWLDAQTDVEGVSLADLAAKDVVRLDPATGAIVVAYPFSGVPTVHRVELVGGRPVYAMCAIDALGIPFMLGVDATVESEDPTTGEQIRISVRDGDATWEPGTACAFFGTSSDDGATAERLCLFVNFFATPANAQAYAAAHPTITGRALDQAAALRSGRRSFGSMLSDEAGEHCTADCCEP